MLALSNVDAGYGGFQALFDVSVTVEAGEAVAVIGANGAGKTTLLRALSGLIKRSGDVRLDGQDINNVKVEHLVQRGMAHVPEGRGVVAELTVEENLRLGGLWRTNKPDLSEIYDLFPPLAQRRSYEGSQLSGGERQMLALGRALIAKPKLLLLDEPSLGLAPLIVAQIMSLLRTLRDDTGLTVLLVEQNVRSALSVADKGVVMSLGRVVTAADASALRDDQDLRHAYLGF
jgi:branched-chain amino acid transport system ATP-binding protein